MAVVVAFVKVESMLNPRECIRLVNLDDDHDFFLVENSWVISFECNFIIELDAFLLSF